MFAIYPDFGKTLNQTLYIMNYLILNYLLCYELIISLRRVNNIVSLSQNALILKRSPLAFYDEYFITCDLFRLWKDFNYKLHPKLCYREKYNLNVSLGTVKKIY